MLLANVSQTTPQVMAPTLPRGLEMYESTIDRYRAVLACLPACRAGCARGRAGGVA